MHVPPRRRCRRAHYGARWTRTPSAQLTRVMRDKVQGYRSNLSVAGDSDARWDGVQFWLTRGLAMHAPLW
jgi:hypothetical protein